MFVFNGPVGSKGSSKNKTFWNVFILVQVIFRRANFDRENYEIVPSSINDISWIRIPIEVEKIESESMNFGFMRSDFFGTENV